MTKLPFLLSSLLLVSSSIKAAPPATPAWGYSVIDQRAGDAGLFVLETGNGPEIFCSSEAGACVWLALKQDPATGDYQVVHVSDPISTSELVAFQSVQVSGDATPELVLVHRDGTIGIYDATTRALLSKLRPSNSAYGFLAHDLEGDGIPEFTVWTFDAFVVFDVNGTEKWRMTGVGGMSIAAGQMDADPGLEIVTSGQQVIDVATRTVQWSLPIYGYHSWSSVAVCDIDEDGREEVIADSTTWKYVDAYDVDTQTLKWSASTGQGIVDLSVANVDADPQKELVVANSGGTQAFDLLSTGLSQKWMVYNPDDMSLGHAVGQLDGDSDLELVRTTRNPDTWGARLRVCGIPSLNEEWVSPPVRGPFVGAAKGDVTGDGIPEYVFASSQSGGKKGSRIQVIDSNTMALTGVSEPVLDPEAGAVVNDVNLCDIDGDGRSEIVVTGSGEAGGDFAGVFAEIYRFDPEDSFAKIWSAPQVYPLEDGRRIEVLDVDGNGDLEVVIAIRGTDPVSGSKIVVFDHDLGTLQWSSPALSSPWVGDLSMAISDVDGDGRLEAVLGVKDAGFEVYDPGAQTVEDTVFMPLLTCLATRAGQTGIVVGMNNGWVSRFFKNGEDYVTGGTTIFGTKSIQQVIPAFGNTLFTVVQDGIRWHAADGALKWETAARPGPWSQRLSPLYTVDGWELFANHAIGGSAFPLSPVNGETIVDLFASGTLHEGTSEEATLVVTRHQAGSAALPVLFSVSGSATVGDDFKIDGATKEAGGLWQAVIPAGEVSTTVSLKLSYDAEAETTESIDFAVAIGSGYLSGPDHVAKLRIVDNEPAVGVRFMDAEISEVPSVKTGEGTDLVFNRTGNLSKSLKVPFTISGTATNGKDFTKLPAFVTFKPGSDRVVIKVVAGRDGIAEGNETLTVSLAPAETHRAETGAESAGLLIKDLASSVQMIEAVPTSKGVNLILYRSQPLDLVQSVTVLEQRAYANGKVKTFRRKVTFPRGSYEGIVSIPGGKLTTQTEWSLVDDKTFFPAGTATLVHEWDLNS
jgi:hypothetical protein